jgi:hypothetical protein
MKHSYVSVILLLLIDVLSRSYIFLFNLFVVISYVWEKNKTKQKKQTKKITCELSIQLHQSRFILIRSISWDIIIRRHEWEYHLSWQLTFVKDGKGQIIEENCMMITHTAQNAIAQLSTTSNIFVYLSIARLSSLVSELSIITATFLCFLSHSSILSSVYVCVCRERERERERDAQLKWVHFSLFSLYSSPSHSPLSSTSHTGAKSNFLFRTKEKWEVLRSHSNFQ